MVLIVFKLVFFVSVIGFQFWKILLFRIYVFFNSIFFLEKIFSLFFLIILMYSLGLIMLFSILFFFKKNGFNSLNNLKNLNQNFFLKFVVICVLLMLAGIPPFFGFFLKSIFFLFFFKKSIFFVCLFLLLSLVSMYFYLQNIRLIINNSTKNIFISFAASPVFSFNIYLFLECSLLIILFGFFLITHF